MLASSVDLGSIKVAGKKSSLSLTLSSSFMITLPPSWPEPPTANELCQASLAGEIWISKAGSCLVEVLTLVNDKNPDTVGFDPGVVAAVVSLSSECPVWKDIGLELRVNHASRSLPDQHHPQASYFLHHPDLSSEMIAPSDVPSARFQGLKCEVNYGLGQSKHKVQTPRDIAADPLSSSQCGPQAPPSHAYNLRSHPKRSRKAVLAQQDISVAVVSSPSSSDPPSEPSFDETGHESLRSLAPEAMVAEMAYLLDFAFRKLIGVKRTSSGIRTVKSMPPPSLTDIAPAVWNLRYLQAISAHAQIIPSIASGIARLRNAKSASLREKVALISPRKASSDDCKQVEADTGTTNEIKKRLWFLCQTGISAEPIRRSDNRRKADENTVEETPSQVDIAGSEVVEHDAPFSYVDEFSDSDAFGTEMGQGAAEYAHCSEFPQELLCGPDISEDAIVSFEVDDGGPPSDLTNSSEADYFYTDGHGNIYPIDSHALPEPDEVAWPPDQQLVECESLGNEEVQELEMGIYGDEYADHTIYYVP
ncbi:hypothetical protein VTK56DRAFT_10085 [Thermocarpiscus australiensis]